MEDSEVAAALSTLLAERIGQQRFDLWFTLQAQLCVRGATLTVRAASAFVRDWLRTHFAEDICHCWLATIGGEGKIDFEIDSELDQVAQSQASAEVTRTKSQSGGLCQRSGPLPSAPDSTDAKACHSRRVAGLAGFVVGSSNEYAFRAAELTARGRQQASPILFCGPTGVGKTHLLRAIQQEYRRHHSRATALYLTAEQFTTNFIEALRGSGLPSFRQKCRGAQLLAIDDLQFFTGKRRTLEELLYTLDTLTADGRQIALASDRGLAELRGLGPELVSRLSGGLTCEISPPEFATRLRIVQKLADEADIALAEGVATLIATQITSGARELRERYIGCRQ